MTQHDPLVRVRHMLDHAREAVALAGPRCRQDLDADRVFSLALVRLMEIVGEAAARVPEEFREQHPQVPWRDMADLRNRLIHGYDSINHDILWAIVKGELPPLVTQLESIITREG